MEIGTRPTSCSNSSSRSFITLRPHSSASSTCAKKITQLGMDGTRLPRYHSKGYAANYYNTARQTVYPRYTEEAWSMATQMAATNAGQERAEAEQFRVETWRTMAESERRVKERQERSSIQLKNRLNAIEYWKNELTSEIRLIDEEQDKCKDKLRQLELMRDHIQKPLHIGEQCLSSRENRRGIDEVKDCAERALNKESKVIGRCLGQIDQLLKRAAVQQKLSRAARQELQKDLEGKNHAANIESHAYGLCNHSEEVRSYTDIELLDNTQSIPSTWTKYTQGNLARSQEQRVKSEHLRSQIDETLKAVSTAVYNQFTAVNNALRARVLETTCARDQLRSALKKVSRELYDTENLLKMLQGAIEDKMAPLRVAETRLMERTRRHNIELCNDNAMKALQTEVTEMHNSIQVLRDRLRHTQINAARLKRNQETLKEDISVKENSLEIDQRCLNVRKTYPIQSKQGSLLSLPVTY